MSMTLWESLARRTEAMVEEAFSGITTLAEWKRVRKQRRREFLSALGIGTLPRRCNPRLIERGGFSGEGYTARKIGFQILPDCWSSAAVYYPDPLPLVRLPGVLYVCGHAENGTYAYQPYAQMWARRGYVCLLVDTIEQADNPGEHHGYSQQWSDTWVSLGYSSAGGETLNAIRALDLLADDPKVDSKRLGVTGQSGGGAVSFYLAVVDERIKAVASLCGISTPIDAVRNRHVSGHCDCFYPLNLFRRDLSEYAALIAPRASLFCFAEHDPLFHPAETLAFVERTRKIYRLYGSEASCERISSPGPHGCHPPFEAATRVVFDRHVAGRPMAQAERTRAEITEPEASVFNGRPPQPNRLDLLPRFVNQRQTLPLPVDETGLRALRAETLQRLPFPVDDATPAHMALDGDWRWGPVDGTAIRAHRGEIDGMDVWLHAVNPVESAPRVIVSIADAGQNSLEAMCAVAVALEPGAGAYGGFEPRASGNNLPHDLPDPWPPGSRLHSSRKLLQRAMVLTGQTPVLMTFQDTKLLVDYLCQRPEMQGREIFLHGRGNPAVAVLYRGLVDERVAGVFLEDLPSSHLGAAPIPAILRVLDIPQAVGLMAPRKVALVRPGHGFWSWPTRLYNRLGCPENLVWVDDLRHAMSQLFRKTYHHETHLEA